MDFPDTEQGHRLQQALRPDSLFDKVAQSWAYASFLTKGAVLAGSTLVFGLLGLGFGASIILSIASMVIGLGVHGLLIAHHEGRVRRITGLFKAQELVREELGDALKSVQEDVVDFIQTQKKEAEDSLVEFKKDAKTLTKVVAAVDEQVGVVVSANKQLEEVGQHIETSLHQVEEQTLSWNKELDQHQEVLSTVIDSAHVFSDLVDNLALSHKAFDTTVGELHEAVVQLTRPSDESGEEVCDVQLDDLSSQIEQPHQINEQINAFDMRYEQYKDKAIKEADLLIEESLIIAHQEGIEASNLALEQLDKRRQALAAQRAMNEVALQKVLDELPSQARHQPKAQVEVNNALSNEELARPAWLESVHQLIIARQERIEAFNKGRITHHEKSVLLEPQAFIDSIEADLKTRSEQRKARRAKLDAACRFFAEASHNTSIHTERSCALSSTINRPLMTQSQP